MDTTEFYNEFNLVYNNLASNQAPGLDKYEISVYLTKAQNMLIDSLYKDSIFQKINQVFDYLPFGVLVDNNILCIHSGLGTSIKLLDDILNIPRPIQVNQNPENNVELQILDLLYSEYN